MRGLKGLSCSETQLKKLRGDNGSGYGIEKLLVENKASGISVAQELRNRLYNHEEFAVQLIDAKGHDKLSRLYSIQHIFAGGADLLLLHWWHGRTWLLRRHRNSLAESTTDLVDIRHLWPSNIFAKSAFSLGAQNVRRRLQSRSNRTSGQEPKSRFTVYNWKNKIDTCERRCRCHESALQHMAKVLASLRSSAGARNRTTCVRTCGITAKDDNMAAREGLDRFVAGSYAAARTEDSEGN